MHCALRALLCQRDNCRRICEQGCLYENDLDEVQSQIEAVNGLVPAPIVESRPIEKAHLVDRSESAPKTILGSIGPLKNVDRLATGQNPLRFAVNGITLIYGANGSGKSGYCRIAKKICRCLHEITLKGNVFEAGTHGDREIHLTFKVGGEDKKRDVLWRDSEDPPSELARISVFDSLSAGLYVDGERRIEFLPYELDVVTKFGTAIRSLEDRFKSREKALLDAVKSPLPSGYTAGTPISIELQKLTTRTELNDLPTEAQLRSLGTWNQQFESEMERLSLELKNDPKTLAQARRRVKLALESLQAEVSGIAAALSDAAIGDLTAKRTDAASKRHLATAAASDLFKAEPIVNIGGDAWRQMLRYARDFAREIYSDRDAPQLATGDYCVLCHQELDAAARDRLTRFDAYLSMRATEDAEKAKIAFEECAKAILTLSPRKASEIPTLLAEFAQLDATRQVLAGRIAGFVSSLSTRHEAVSSAIKRVDYEALDRLSALPSEPGSDLKAEIARVESEAVEFDKLALNDVDGNKRKTAFATLGDQKKLASDIEMVVGRRNTFDDLRRVISCKAACALSQITAHLTRLRREVLTPSLANNLKNEIEAFDLAYLPLKLSDRGEHGDSRVQINLESSHRIEKNSHVLSEGEQRALALAGFLAELKEVGGTHGIVVDDPVSSLDHSRMEAVAKRLVAEAATGRQVIVFTHNLFFHHAMMSEAQSAQVPVRTEWIAKSSDGVFGIIDDQQRPWHLMKVNQRLEILSKEIAAGKSTYNPNDESCRMFVRRIYTMLRETWERTVEEVLFADVVGRFRPEIQTLKLRSASVTQDDYKAVYAGMKRSSRFSGHDQAIGTPPDLPKFTDIENDWEILSVYFRGADSDGSRPGFRDDFAHHSDLMSPAIPG